MCPSSCACALGVRARGGVHPEGGDLWIHRGGRPKDVLPPPTQAEAAQPSQSQCPPLAVCGGELFVAGEAPAISVPSLPPAMQPLPTEPQPEPTVQPPPSGRRLILSPWPRPPAHLCFISTRLGVSTHGEPPGTSRPLLAQFSGILLFFPESQGIHRSPPQPGPRWGWGLRSCPCSLRPGDPGAGSRDCEVQPLTWGHG